MSRTLLALRLRRAWTRLLPSSLVPRSSVQAPPRPGGSLTRSSVQAAPRLFGSPGLCLPAAAWRTIVDDKCRANSAGGGLDVIY